MSRAYEQRLEAYRKLREQHPDEPLRFFADEFDVNIGTVSRWNKALKKLDIQGEALDELETRLRKEYEAKLRAVLEEKEAEREERERKKREAEQRKSESRREHFKRIFDTCQKVDIWPSKTIDVTWQGFRVTLIGGVKNTVPEVIAGVYLGSQEQGKQAGQIIARYKEGQYLGKM